MPEQIDTTAEINLGGGTDIAEIKKTERRTAKAKFNAIRTSPWMSLAFCLLIPLITTFTLEWIARGTFAPNKQGNGFFQALTGHFPSFLLSYIFLLCIYVFVSHISGWHALATGVVGLLGNVPAVVTHYKLTMRGEPFLPWDLNQLNELADIGSEVKLTIPPRIFIVAVIFIILTVAAGFVKIPPTPEGKTDYFSRFVAAGTALACGLFLLFGVFLNPKGTKAMGIRPDAWMQDRYYRTNGVITGFLTNLQMLKISQPDGYSKDNAASIIAEVTLARQNGGQPLYKNCYAEKTQSPVQNPDIIFIMAESFWDVTALPGVEYDQPVMPNFERLAAQSASGKAYVPSFGGGTCDVEFEVLTGFSMEFLPAGSKPYQQYITSEISALPQNLKDSGYQTLAIHGYGKRFWNRDMAYPNLGIDDFIASEDFINPEKRRGHISDNAMADRIISEYTSRKSDGPMFIHAVTMQNHTTYNRNKYPEDELVLVTKAPADIPNSTIGQLEDCATGIREMDAALGKLCDFFSRQERPAIIVFWGDHLNPMSDGYALFEKTGFIEKGDTSSPMLRQTPLLIWSNYYQQPLDLGVISSYNITPVMMDLYGLEKPVMFEFLTKQMPVMHGRTRGTIIETDNTFAYEMTEAQQEAFNKHSVLQYNILFDGADAFSNDTKD